jgi:ABC-type uncharacterized transport system permease subunit
MKNFIKEAIKLIYIKFGYFLMILLGLSIIFNRTSEINGWIGMPIVVIIMLTALFTMVMVEFNDDKDSFTVRFLRRFTKIDVLLACVLIIFYIGACNGWVDMVQ